MLWEENASRPHVRSARRQWPWATEEGDADTMVAFPFFYTLARPRLWTMKAAGHETTDIFHNRRQQLTSEWRQRLAERSEMAAKYPCTQFAPSPAVRSFA